MVGIKSQVGLVAVVGVKQAVLLKQRLQSSSGNGGGGGIIHRKREGIGGGIKSTDLVRAVG